MAMLGNVFGCFRWGVLLGVSFLVAGPASAAYETPYWDVQRTNGVVYGQGRVANGASWKDLELDLYEPIGNPDQKKPAIVLIHGGGFTGGSRGGMQAYGNYFASRGYVAASVSYRLLGENPVADPGYAFWPQSPGLAPAVHAAAVDAARAVRWLRANADQYGIDPNFVLAGGISAGGITAGNLAIAGPAGSEEYQTELPGDVALEINNPGEASLVQGVFNFCGGAGPSVTDSSDAPMLLVHTTGDGTVPVLLADVVAAWYDAAPAPLEYYRLQQSGHCTFLSGTVDGLTPRDLTTRFFNRTVWDVEPELMAARRLLIRDSETRPERRKFSFVAGGSGEDSNALVLPAPDSDGDPSRYGMVVEVYASTGDPNDYRRYHLPAAGWTRLGREGTMGYKYKDKQAEYGPVSKVVMKSGQLKITARGVDVPDLASAPHQGFSVRVRVAAETPWCASTLGSSDTTQRYQGVKQSTALPCVARPQL